MVSRKYTKDYRVDYEQGKHGRIKTNTYYVGDYYSFVSEPHQVARAKRIYLICTVLCVASFASFAVKSTAAYTMYVSIPQALAVFPLMYLVMGVYGLLVRKAPFTREQSDKTSNRIISSSFGVLLFSTVALCGDVVCWFVNSSNMQYPGDIVTTVLLFVLCAASGVCVSLRNRIATSVDYSIPNPNR